MFSRLRSYFTLFTKPYLCLGILLAGFTALYFSYAGNADYGDYYWMLGDAFLSGHTYVLPGGLFDMSFFHGQYYLYWGPVPVVMVYVPIKLLTGIGVKAYFMVPFLASIGTVFLSVLVYRIASSQRPVNSWGLLFVVLSVGLGSWIPFMCHIPAVGTAAVAGAYCFSAMGALCLWLFLNNPQKKYWAILASLCFGLAVGCRGNHVTNIILLLVGCLAMWRTAENRSVRLGYLIRLLLPWMLCMAALAGYNYARFDNPLESGHMYHNHNKDNDFYYKMMSGAIPQTNPFFLPCMSCSEELFALNNIPYNVYYYLLNPLRYGNSVNPDSNASPFSAHNLIPPEHSPNTYIFPWLNEILAARGYADSPAERTYGLLAASPFSLWYLAFLFDRRARKLWLPATRTVMVGMELYSGITFLMLCAFFWHAQRYTGDFAPWMMALGGIYYLALLQRTERKSLRRLLLILGGIAAAYGVFTGLMVGYCAWDHC